MFSPTDGEEAANNENNGLTESQRIVKDHMQLGISDERISSSKGVQREVQPGVGGEELLRDGGAVDDQPARQAS